MSLYGPAWTDECRDALHDRIGSRSALLWLHGMPVTFSRTEEVVHVTTTEEDDLICRQICDQGEVIYWPFNIVWLGY